MIVNLISDTVTKPSAAMLEAMFSAEVGDDVFRQDPTVNRLEAYTAELFGKEAALYCPSGTMTNQIAIKCHTQPLDQIICDQSSHVYQYETGGPAFHSGVSMKLLKGTHGKITASQVEEAIEADYDWLPVSRLVVIENTCNKGGGSIYRLPEVLPIRTLCQERGLALHLDGARLFNALVETQETTKAWGAAFDSISICLSKGLGAPVGSLLIGDVDFIKKARRVRKVMGGGMRQAGYIAAAGLYALQNNVERLSIDNQRARQAGAVLQQQSYVSAVRPVQSNIVIFDLAGKLSAADFLATMEEQGILAVAFGPQTVRLTFHLDISSEMMERVIEVLSNYETAG